MKENRGGARQGAGRPRVEKGNRHTWIIPEDIEQVARERGTAFIWDAVRFKLKLDTILN